MRIEVRSKSLAKDFIGDQPWAAISIATFSHEFAKLNATKRMGLLQMEFADVDREDQVGTINALCKSESHEPTCFFTEYQAEKIVDFVQQMKIKGIELFLVHCEAGVSRSPAIAAAIHKIFIDNNDNEYFKRYRPNMHVYSTIINHAHEKGLI